jgi:hypothetical protein
LDAVGRIVYRNLTGALWFDADGNGAGAAVRLALPHDGVVITAAAFLVL